MDLEVHSASRRCLWPLLIFSHSETLLSTVERSRNSCFHFSVGLRALHRNRNQSKVKQGLKEQDSVRQKKGEAHELAKPSSRAVPVNCWCVPRETRDRGNSRKLGSTETHSTRSSPSPLVSIDSALESR